MLTSMIFTAQGINPGGKYSNLSVDISQEQGEPMRNSNVNRHVYLAPTPKHYEWAMYKLGVRVVKRGKFVLLLTKEPFYLPLLISEEPAELWQLERFVVVLLQDIESVHKKLFQLKDWVYLPDLIIVDLYSYIKEVELDPEPNGSVAATLVRHIARCAACLLDLANRVQRRKAQQENIIFVTEEESSPDDEVNVEALDDNDTIQYSTASSETLPIAENEWETSERQLHFTTSLILTPLTPNNPSEKLSPNYADNDRFQSNKSNVKVALLNNTLAEENLQVPEENLPEVTFATYGESKLTPTTASTSFSKSNSITIASTQPMFSHSAVELNSGGTQSGQKTLTSLTKLAVLTPTELNEARTRHIQYLQQSICNTTCVTHCAKQEKPVDAVFIMPSNPAPMTQRQLEVIVVLYFYEQCVCYDFDEIVRRVQSTQKLSV